MDASINKVIRDLQAKQREFREKIDKIESTIRSLQEVFGEQQMVLPVAEPIPQTETPRMGIYVGLSIGVAAIKFLRSTGSPQKTREIANALEQGGVKSTDIYRAVYNALNTNEEVVMVEGKRWALAEWET